MSVGVSSETSRSLLLVNDDKVTADTIYPGYAVLRDEDPKALRSFAMKYSAERCAHLDLCEHYKVLYKQYNELLNMIQAHDMWHLFFSDRIPASQKM